jgi:ParB family chromosome partitioning protein
VEDSGARQLPVRSVRPNPFQPRRTFADEDLQELAASIREHGILQPIVVRPAGDGFEVVAGERRLRAAQLAGLETIPALLRRATDEEMQVLALVENLQRVDLNAIEKARALRSLMGSLGLTQEEVAERVGKARTTIANLLRLLDLPQELQGLVEGGQLSGAHARALLLAKSPERRLALAKRAVAEGWSVRELERRAADTGPRPPRKAAPTDPYLADIEERLRRVLSLPVELRRQGKGGVVTLRYHDAQDLDRLLELLEA